VTYTLNPSAAPTVTITSAGGTTTQASQTITGTVDVADAGSTVKVFDGTTQIGTAIVSAVGNWSDSVTLSGAGANVVTATDANAAGTGTSNAVTYTLNPATAGPGATLHYAANGNFVGGVYAPGVDGFNLADVSSAAQLSSLPTGVKGLVYLGMTDGVTAAFKSAVNASIGNPNLYGFYLADEPDASATTAANLKAEADYIKANVPGAISFITEQNLSSDTSPVYYYTPANTDINLFGIDPYPVQTNVPNNLDYGVIPLAVTAAENVGIPLADIVPVYQAFGGGRGSTFILPTPAQEQQILATWASVDPAPAFDYAYSWGKQGGDTALSNDPALAAVFAAHNAASGSPAPTAAITGAAAAVTPAALGANVLTASLSNGGSVSGAATTDPTASTVAASPVDVQSAGATALSPVSSTTNAKLALLNQFVASGFENEGSGAPSLASIAAQSASENAFLAASRHG
jgi:hypothetical protein